MRAKKPCVVYTLFPSNKATSGTPVIATLEEFASHASKVYRAKDAQPLAVPDQLPEHSRAKQNKAISATSIFLDFDKPGMALESALASLKALGAAFVAYATYSWAPKKERYRIVLPLSKPIELAERDNLIARLGVVLPGIAPETDDKKRGFYVGTIAGAPAPTWREGTTADNLSLPAAPAAAAKPSTASGISTKDNPFAKAQELKAKYGHKLRDAEGRWAAVEFMATRMSARGYEPEKCYAWLNEMIATYFDPRDVSSEQRRQWESRVAYWLNRDMPKRTQRIVETKRPRPELKGEMAGLPTTFNVQELLDMKLPETQWVFEGLLPPGLALIAGPPKIGKSALMLALTLAAASGTTFLGKYKANKCKAVYYDLESGHHLLRERLLPLMTALKITAKDLKNHMSFSLVMDTGANAIAQLRAELQADPDIRLVVVDLFARIRDAENKERKSVYQLDYDTMSQFQDVCADYPSLCLLLVHHTNKRSSGQTDHWQDMISGSHGLAGATHTNLAMGRVVRQGMTDEEREKFKHYAMFYATGKRVKDTDLVLKQTGDGVTWAISDQSLNEVKQSDTMQEILAVVRSDLNRLWSAPEIADELGKNRNTVKNIILGAKRRGELVSPTGKGYTLPSNVGKTVTGPKVGGNKKGTA